MKNIKKIIVGVALSLLMFTGVVHADRTFSLPNQTGHGGQFLQTNGTNPLWATAGGGGGGTVTSISGVNSITATPNPITATGTLQLVNDTATPGNLKYYGTDGAGAKGFFALPGGTITGSGIANQVTYWNGTTSITGDTNFVWDPTLTQFSVGGLNASIAVQGNLGNVVLSESSGLIIRAVSYNFPGANAVGQLTNDGGGNLSWTAIAGAPIYPSVQIPFGDGVTPGGITNADFTWNESRGAFTTQGSTNGVVIASDDTADQFRADVDFGSYGIYLAGLNSAGFGTQSGLSIDAPNRLYTLGDFAARANGTYFQVDDGNQYLVANKYPNTRNDTGTFTPTSFLYTDPTGIIYEAPLSAIPITVSGTPTQAAYFDANTGLLTSDANFTRDQNTDFNTTVTATDGSFISRLLLDGTGASSTYLKNTEASGNYGYINLFPQGGNIQVAVGSTDSSSTIYSAFATFNDTATKMFWTNGVTSQVSSITFDNTQNTSSINDVLGANTFASSSILTPTSSLFSYQDITGTKLSSLLLDNTQALTKYTWINAESVSQLASTSATFAFTNTLAGVSTQLILTDQVATLGTTSGGNNTHIKIDDVAQQTQFVSGVKYPRTTVNVLYTILNSDYYVDVDATIGVSTINLPDAATVGPGTTFIITDYNGGSAVNNITVTPAFANTIQGAGTYVILNNYQSITVHSDGSANWIIN